MSAATRTGPTAITVTATNDDVADSLALAATREEWPSILEHRKTNTRLDHPRPQCRVTDKEEC
jgi:hypothetical protein